MSLQMHWSFRIRTVMSKFIEIIVWLKSKFYAQVILLYKSNKCYEWQLKVVQKGLKKRGFNFSYYGTSDWEKESLLIKVKKNVPHSI